jgi:hypothetical protein
MDPCDTSNQIDDLNLCVEAFDSIVDDLVLIFIGCLIKGYMTPAGEGSLRLRKPCGNEMAPLVIEYAHTNENERIAHRLGHIIKEAEYRILELKQFRVTILLNIQCDLLRADDCPGLQYQLTQEVMDSALYIGYLVDIHSNPTQVLQYADIEVLDVTSQGEWLWVVSV